MDSVTEKMVEKACSPTSSRSMTIEAIDIITDIGGDEARDSLILISDKLDFRDKTLSEYALKQLHKIIKSHQIH